MNCQKNQNSPFHLRYILYLKTKQNIKDKEVSKPAGSDTVGAMAKRATDLGDDIGEGLKSPHKKGSRKYKKQLAAKHAAMAAR